MIAPISVAYRCLSTDVFQNSIAVVLSMVFRSLILFSNFSVIEDVVAVEVRMTDVNVEMIGESNSNFEMLNMGSGHFRQPLNISYLDAEINPSFHSVQNSFNVHPMPRQATKKQNLGLLESLQSPPMTINDLNSRSFWECTKRIPAEIQQNLH